MLDPELNQLIEQVIYHIQQNQHPIVDDALLNTLEDNVELAFPLLEFLLNVDGEREDDFEDEEMADLREHAALVLLSEIISYSCYAHEQGRPWADEFVTDFQLAFADLGFLPHVDQSITQRVLDLLRQAEVPIIDAVRNANSELVNSNDDGSEGMYPEDIGELLEEIANISSQHCYEMYESLINQTHQIVPEEVQYVMLSEMANAKNPLIRDTAILMLLHPDKTIRQQVPYILRDMIAQRSLTPAGLRRMITMRNWLPVNERGPIDDLIRGARRARIECEQWPRPKILKLFATGFDGVGAQSIVGLSQLGDQFFLTGLLLKENIGIREPMIIYSHKKAELTSMLDTMLRELPCQPISEEYLNQVMPHFLWFGVENGQPPSPLLLGVCEALGHCNWHGQQFDTALLLEELLGEYQQSEHAPRDLRHVLAKSQNWPQTRDFACSWYEHDAEVRHLVHAYFQKHSTQLNTQDIAELVDELCNTVLDGRRHKWATRLMRMGLWARYVKRKSKPNWADFLLLAKEVLSPRALTEIPLMKSISEETLMAITEQWAKEDHHKPALVR